MEESSTAPAGSHDIFVYGTLLTGGGNAKIIPATAKRVKAVTTSGFALHAAGIPYMSRMGTGRVGGEVVTVDDRTLAWLDTLEGHPTHYTRSPILVTMGCEEIHSPDRPCNKGYTKLVEAYLYNHRPVRGALIAPDVDNIIRWKPNTVHMGT